jgi:hypothetical protein
MAAADRLIRVQIAAVDGEARQVLRAAGGLVATVARGIAAACGLHILAMSTLIRRGAGLA